MLEDGTGTEKTFAAIQAVVEKYLPLVRETTVLRVSPHPAAPVLAQASAWALVVVERSEGGWLLVSSPDGGRGWLPGEAVAPLASVD